MLCSVLVWWALMLASSLAGAHPLAPVGLDVRELGGGAVQVRFKRSLVQRRGARIALQLPERCELSHERRVETQAGSVIEHVTLDCGTAALTGASFGVDGLQDASVDVVVRIELADGQVHRALLSGTRDHFRVPAATSSLDTAVGYLRLGFAHMLGGLDHLLFVVGLMLLVVSRRRVILALTAFTVGHSVTLCLAALGWLVLPTGIVEIAIAVTLMLLALQILGRKGERAPAGALRQPWLMAAAFGLLHGLGFASALAETGLPEGEVPLALASFNVGVELAQVVVVVLVSVAAIVLRRLPDSPLWRRRLPAYAIGSLAGMWCIERTLVAVTG